MFELGETAVSDCVGDLTEVELKLDLLPTVVASGESFFVVDEEETAWSGKIKIFNFRKVHPHLILIPRTETRETQNIIDVFVPVCLDVEVPGGDIKEDAVAAAPAGEGETPWPKLLNPLLTDEDEALFMGFLTSEVVIFTMVPACG